MIIKKKYKQLVDFVKVLNKFVDCDSLVEISEDEYNILAEFVSAVNNIDYDGEPEETGNYATVEYVNNKINEVVNNLPNVPNNVVTSNTENLKLDVVASMPETLNENTLYIMQ